MIANAILAIGLMGCLGLCLCGVIVVVELTHGLALFAIPVIATFILCYSFVDHVRGG